MSIHTEALARALFQLEQSLEYYQSDIAKNDPAMQIQFRTAAIQGFEYSFELAFRLLKRTLKQMPVTQALDSMTYKELARLGAETGLIADPTHWFEHRLSRNKTSHAYDDATAQAVFLNIPFFVKDAYALLNQLRKHEDEHDEAE